MSNTQMNDRELEAFREIRNSLIKRGRPPSVRELMIDLGYRSPRSAAVLIDRLIEKGLLRRKADGGLQLLAEPELNQDHAQTVNVPLVGTVACGSPILADENIEAVIPVSTKMAKPPHQYFLLKVNGDSMNECQIYDHDLVLIRQQTTADNGDLVVALIDTEATVKEFHRSRNTIILKPRSSNRGHQPIVLTEDFQIQGIVVATLPKEVLN
ncbi:repressor LexA [bacterium (Candidatus Blackallbacteria) CG17_big_fil_post_rev_8_21_14_2_50_48_46]|uniref:Repressor LexA n=1 Tax=bacterium (Candidatus Blackallbacteria) CG17_big_fil_post_rev_8_21_14_2_50_48_46 TaxID=2014261 RepID=A0A2M7G1A4_9BACT|nr:MAG: repressor LexA [bacterium (Candidatus Blackallbacteria) CG18_big_fil_WC_8_21_14_2_50_49_26]PIW15317.1 MAG: repressor LexA [bacterium (Candidatus Blackallbacteria) CG17_big_fil_post_rev_8_21_14_2_50_48_46]PIW45173.1 MAG: repressor LexA [bacterium (Candidatus Blackallbacteria) CG13_big_fil_rev_8_21_14_2_50_49_14]